MLVVRTLFVQFDQYSQQINKNVLEGFGGINVGLIVIRDPITAFVPRLSHPQPMPSGEKTTFQRGTHTN